MDTTILNIGKTQARQVSRVIGRNLNQSAKGKRLLAAFKKDRDLGGAAILDYVDARLSEDDALKRQLADTLGGQLGEQFITIVNSGGSVGEIININHLDTLTIHYFFYVFSDVRQLVVFLATMISVGVAITYGVWWTQQPRKLDGEFNIAVATFAQQGGADGEVGASFSQRLFDFLEIQYKLGGFESNVDVAHDKIGIIAGATEAEAIATRINAHLVIFGDVIVQGNAILVQPKFYISQAFRADVAEVNGQHEFTPPFNLTSFEIIDPKNENINTFQQRTKILSEFTKALVFMAADDLLQARRAIDSAIIEGEGYGDFDGKEVLYLFASEITRLEGDLEAAQAYLDNAFELNKAYARGLIAQGNIYYDQENLFRAKQTYETAQQLEIENPSPGAFIFEKASIGIGNTCTVQLQFVLRQAMGDQSGVDELANCAKRNFSLVFDKYDQGIASSSSLMREITALALFNLGIVHQELTECDDAEQVFLRSVDLNSDREEEAAIRLQNCKNALK